jgi:polygalacturonase
MRGLASVFLLSIAASVAAGAAPAQTDGWEARDAILKRIVAPRFPDRDFSIGAYGARGDGETDAHPAIVQAIDACRAAGGGRVVIPAGVFLSNGPVHLRSNVNLHLLEGAVLRFGTNPDDYLPVVLTRWGGVLVYNYSPLIYARRETNVAVTGKGTIDGGAREGFYRFVQVRDANGARAHEVDRDAAWTMGAAQVPVEKRRFGAGCYLRPGGLEPFECTNVLIEGVTFTNMPQWIIHPIFCRNVTVRGVRVDSPNGNNDGCNPDSCTDVLIEDSHFVTGDDSISIKSGRDQDGRGTGRPSENIVIRNITAAGLYGFAIGSEMAGGVRNVFIEKCRVLSGRAAIYTKGNRDRGGVVEHVRDIEVENVREAAVRFETNYHGYRGEDHPPRFRDFVIERVRCRKSNAYGIYVEGQPDAPVRDVTLRDIEVGEARVPLWIRNVRDVRFEGVKINDAAQPGVPPLTPEDETKLEILD